MKKINDILKDLDKNIYIEYVKKISKLIVIKLGKRNTIDIFKKLKNINLSRGKKINLLKNNTRNFDSFTKNKRLKNINLIKKKKINFKNKNIFNKKLFKTIIFTFLSIIVFYLIIGTIIQGYIKNGYNNIISISNFSNNIEDIKEKSNNSKFDFIISDFLFKPFLLVPNKHIDDIYYIIKGGKSLSILIDDFLNYYSKIYGFIEGKEINDIYFTNILYNSKDYITSFSNSLNNALYNFNNIGDIFNGELKDKFQKGKSDLQYIYNFLTILDRNYDTFLNIFGHKKEKKYLVLFQNNDEIRPTGGFIGSLGIIDIFKGKVTDFEKLDIYALEWEINKVYTNKIKSPEGINKLTPNLGIRDANFKIDFNGSSEEIKFFTDKINIKIDGIIYINQNIILDLMEEIGPIQFEKIGEEINSENFSQMISTLVEAKTFKVGTLGSPKQILFDFTGIFVKKLLEDKKYGKYLKLILKHIKSRDIVITSFNSEENSLLWKLGLNGVVNYGETLDYNYTVFTSIGGGKTDRYMERKYIKNVNINEDCSIDTSLKIIQTHLFTKIEEDKLNNLIKKYNITDNNIINIQGKTDNKQFVQLILPQDAIIKKEDFFTINKTNNSKIIKFYTNTRRLESINQTIEYTIPNNKCKKYNYSFYKQPGIKNYSIEININGNDYKYDNINNDFYFENY